MKTWLVTIAFALAVAAAGARCGAEVPLGVDPASDAAAGHDDGGADGDGG